uniref:PITH domain-containing protein n=1 Tax=Tetraselmis chuii TaxID=63592 RepID=A0A7S1SJV3_9CHLO|mmetsp:Transcript_16132/g.28686  ORF Transcript_16132/g.28686 Transcript_16132/m.28686 type:complete len:148 (+) Transcript_16132:78-521(+)
MASGGCCGHDHDCDAEDCAPQWSLYKYIDTSQVSCLNEEVAGSCRGVFKAWHQRTEPTTPPLKSNDDDCELLLHIPFTGDVKLSSICVVGGDDGSAPAKMRACVTLPLPIPSPPPLPIPPLPFVPFLPLPLSLFPPFPSAVRPHLRC